MKRLANKFGLIAQQSQPKQPNPVMAETDDVVRAVFLSDEMSRQHPGKSVYVSHLSLLLQRDDIRLASVMAKVETTQLMLTSLAETDGPSLSKFKHELGDDNSYKDYKLLNPIADHTFQNDRSAVLDKLIECIDRRFHDCTHDPIFTAGNVFDPKMLPSETKKVRPRKDLVKLCTQIVIPAEIHEWYKSLPTTSRTKDRLPEPAVGDSADDDSA